MDLKVDSELVDLLRDVVAESGCPDRKSLLGSQPRLRDGHQSLGRGPQVTTGGAQWQKISTIFCCEHRAGLKVNIKLFLYNLINGYLING